MMKPIARIRAWFKEIGPVFLEFFDLARLVIAVVAVLSVEVVGVMKLWKILLGH